MKSITDPKEIFQVEMWLVELKTLFECEVLTQPEDMKQVYQEKANEIKEFLDKR